jgi:uncharacterized SAM-binding protein YcdF (DUF218 family)
MTAAEMIGGLIEDAADEIVYFRATCLRNFGGYILPDIHTSTLPVSQPAPRRKRIAIGLAVAVLAIGLAWLEREPILRHIGAWWVISDDLAPADAVVVLGGDLDVRPFAAAEIYKHGLAGTILVSNVQLGKAERLGFIPSHTELNRDILLKLGVPIAAIVAFGDNLSSTQQEAAAVRQWAEQSQAKRIIVPTELFTARRTRWIFDRELAPIGVQVIVYALPAVQYTLADWWRHHDGLVDFNNEVLKYLYYRVQY